MNPFRSAALRMTFWYLAIVVAVSTSSSVAIYHFSSNDLRRGVQRQIEFYSQVLSPEESRAYSRLRLAQLETDQQHLRDRLLLFNLLVLAGGGIASYGLARKTMRPLEGTVPHWFGVKLRKSKRKTRIKKANSPMVCFKFPPKYLDTFCMRAGNLHGWKDGRLEVRA